MSLSEIITDSIKYPFSDITKFLIVGVIALLAGLSNIFASFNVDSMAILVIGGVIGLVFALILSGIGLSVIREAINYSSEIPNIDPVNNFIDGIKVLIISIVYFIIPIIITLVIAFVTGAIGYGLNHLASGLGVGLIIAVIVFILFAIFELIAVARFAKTDEFGDAFDFAAIVDDAKSIGFLNIIALIIVALIIIIIASIIVSVFTFIPFVGIFIAQILIGGFVALFYNRAIGLLYAEI